jgi:hypothetical protein
MTTKRNATYVSRHRQRQRLIGLRRVEVAVKAKDAALLKAIAATLRADGPEAERLRASLQHLLAILRWGALFGDETAFARDKAVRPPFFFT